MTGLTNCGFGVEERRLVLILKVGICGVTQAGARGHMVSLGWLASNHECS